MKLGRLLKKLALALLVLAAAVGVERSLNHQNKMEAARLLNSQHGLSVVGKQALVFGGTSGIGRALAERLAADGASVTIAGRSEKEGQQIVVDMKKTFSNPDSATFSFLRVDAMLMENNKVAVEKFLLEQKITRLDYLIFCQTKATLQGRTLTKEGIDEKLSLNYYSRVYITSLLAPLMQETAEKDKNADPRVMSVLSAGFHPPYEHYKEDPYLSDPGRYSQKLAADITSFYNDLWMDKASQTWSKVSFTHIAPGLVNTNWGSDMPFVVKAAIRALQATIAKPAADCATLLLPALTNPSLGGGGFRMLGEYSEPMPRTRLHTAEAVEQVHKDTSILLERALHQQEKK